MKVYRVGPDGEEQVIRVLGTGRSFNDVPVFDGGPNPASVAALEPSVVGYLPKAEVLAFVRDRPEVAAAVIKVLASRLRALTVVVQDLALRGVVARVAKVLLDRARGEPTLVEGAPMACARLTQEQLAAMVGSVREVVQRALKTLGRDGAVKLERPRVVVLDPQAPRRWSEPTRAEGRAASPAGGLATGPAGPSRKGRRLAGRAALRRALPGSRGEREAPLRAPVEVALRGLG